MNWSEIITTVFGSLMFPFLIIIAWDRAADKIGTFAGIAMAGFIVGTSWLANHGVGLIVQGPNAVWIDMALAGAAGLMVHSMLQGSSFKKALPTIISACVGGVIAGIVAAAV